MRKTNLLRDLTGFTSKSKTRPVLETLNFNSDGNIYATDSHIGVCLVGYNTAGVDLNLHPKTLEVCSDKYPDVSRLKASTTELETSIALSNVKLFLAYVKAIKTGSVELKFTPNRLVLGGIIIETSIADTFNITLSAENLHRVFRFIVGTNLPVVQLKMTESRLRPIYFEVEDYYWVILAPIRTA